MPTSISRLADVHPRAQIGENVQVGPFCLIGPDVSLGDDCVLDSHVVLTGRTTIGRRNRFWPNAVIGGEPQDKSYVEGATQTIIGDDNQFREGTTVHRGAEKEDGITRIGHRNLLMANAHVAHNCLIANDTILVNGVLLGGHVHIEDRAIISGNSVVHHFTTIGTVAFVGGGSRVTVDVPPYMLAFGSDRVQIRNINLVGMQRAGLSASTIAHIKQAFRLLFRQTRPLQEVQATLSEQIGAAIPVELARLFDFIERQQNGRFGRQREVVRLKSAESTKEAA